MHVFKNKMTLHFERITTYYVFMVLLKEENGKTTKPLSFCVQFQWKPFSVISEYTCVEVKEI